MKKNIFNDSSRYRITSYNVCYTKLLRILDGIKTKIADKKIYYDKGCDLVEDKVTQSYFNQLSFNNKNGFKATYWT